MIVALLLFLNGMVNDSMRIKKTLRKKDQIDVEMQAFVMVESKLIQTDDPAKLPVLTEEPSTSLEILYFTSRYLHFYFTFTLHFYFSLDLVNFC